MKTNDRDKKKQKKKENVVILLVLLSMSRARFCLLAPLPRVGRQSIHSVRPELSTATPSPHIVTHYRTHITVSSGTVDGSRRSLGNSQHWGEGKGTGRPRDVLSSTQTGTENTKLVTENNNTPRTVLTNPATN